MSATSGVLDATACEHDNEGVHLVCHCTDESVAACGVDVSSEEWAEGADCTFCGLVWATSAPNCPWGCCCAECRWSAS